MPSFNILVKRSYVLYMCISPLLSFVAMSESSSPSQRLLEESSAVQSETKLEQEDFATMAETIDGKNVGRW